MSWHTDNIMATLLGRTPSSSKSTNASNNGGRSTPQGRRPAQLVHSKSCGGGEQSSFSPQTATPRARPSGKRVPRRSSSSLCAISSSPPTVGATFYNSNYQGRLQTPRRMRENGSSSPFAGSKFSDSPSARVIPMPPVHWFEDEEEEALGAVSMGSATSSDTESLASSSSDSGSVPTSAESLTDSLAGVRINPLHLIAAVAAS